MYYQNNYGNGERGFILPFVVGALAGGAAIGITRPRPVVVTSGPGYGYPSYGPYYGPGSGYYNNSYFYYRPF